MTGRPRAADDFDAIRARLGELRADRSAAIAGDDGTIRVVGADGDVRRWVLHKGEMREVFPAPPCPAAFVLGLIRETPIAELDPALRRALRLAPAPRLGRAARR